MQPSTYLKLIAGSVPDHSQGMVDDSIRLLAQEALGANEIHYVRSPNPVNGRYHYLALPSASLASEMSPVTPLAMALPGHPEHQGPGIYVLDVRQYLVAVIFDGSQMDLVCNEHSIVAEFLADQGLAQIEVPATAVAWRFESAETKRNQLVEAVSLRVVRYSLTALTIFALLGGCLMAADGWLTAKVANNNQATAEALASALKTIQVGSPLSKAMAHYEKKSAVAVRAGGWVDSYLYRDGKESFRFFVPTWISPDYQQALGDKVSADRDPANEQLLILTKGEPVGGQFITSNETVAKPDTKPASAPAQPPVPQLKTQ